MLGRMNIPKLEDILLNPQKINKRIYKIHYPEFIDLLDNIYPDIKFSEQLYRYYYNLKEAPKCPICNNPCKYLNFTLGYSKHCSTKCASSDENVKLKTKSTLLEKYGTTNYNNREQCIKTCQEKYGCDNVFQDNTIKEKIKQTNNKKYGVDYPSQSKQIQKIREKNTLKKYGVKHHMMLDSVKEKVNKSLVEYHIKNDPNMISYEDNGDRRMHCPHPSCNKCQEKYYIINSINYYARREYNLEPCTRILPIGSCHSSGTTLELFVRNLLDEYNVEYKTNIRDIIAPYELDIYIPSKKIAIECNGLYWHSSKDKKYHSNKYNLCAQQGIQLLTLWEDQIINKPKIIKSIILSKLGIYKEKIGARKCIVKYINSYECSNFLNNNHLQGSTKPQIRIGLYYKDELVSVMTFAKRNALSGSKTNHEWELTRFCNKLYTTIIGGASKLLNRFIKDYNAKIIYSFASNDISNGGLYKTLGFIQEDETYAYWYIDKKTLQRYHRSRFTKSNLNKMGYKEGTEESIMRNLPYYKIYDCGHIRYKLEI